LTVQSLMLAMGTGRVNLTGSLDLKTNRAGAHAILQNVDLSQAIGPPESPDAPRGIADGDLLLDGPLSDPDVQANLRVVHPLRGIATGTVRVTGTAGAPAFAMHVTASSVAYHGVESATAELVGNYAAQRLTLEHLDFARDGATTHVEGSIPIDLSLYGGHATLRDSPVALKLRMVDADFSVAALFDPEFAASAGKLNVTADLS